jgi:hypothetical protein
LVCVTPRSCRMFRYSPRSFVGRLLAVLCISRFSFRWMT